MEWPIKDALPEEAAALAELWYRGWQDAHDGLLPPELVRLRSRQSFIDRMKASLDSVRSAGPAGAPLGFSMMKGDELSQLYLARPARGSGLASALIEDAEQSMRNRQADRIWLSCAIGNNRAARFSPIGASSTLAHPPLAYGLLVHSILFGELRDRSLRSLYCLSDGVRSALASDQGRPNASPWRSCAEPVP